LNEQAGKGGRINSSGLSWSVWSALGFQIPTGLRFHLSRCLHRLPPKVTAAQPTATSFQPASSGVVPLSPDHEQALKPKDTFKECDNCPEMVVVPARSFTMGSPDGETERFNDEGPQHTVTIDRPFAAGAFAAMLLRVYAALAFFIISAGWVAVYLGLFAKRTS
jgi:hypothetical protein